MIVIALLSMAVFDLWLQVVSIHGTIETVNL